MFKSRGNRKCNVHNRILGLTLAIECSSVVMCCLACRPPWTTCSCKLVQKPITTKKAMSGTTRGEKQN